MDSHRIKLVVAVLLLLPRLFWAQEAQLSSAQQRAYDERKLTVQTYVGASGKPDPATRYWWATYGYERVDEATFLQVAGYPEEAQRSRRNRTAKGVFTWGGLAGSLAGSIMFGLGLGNAITASVVEEEKSAFLDPIFLGGVCLMIGSSIATGYGVARPPNITPFGKAATIVEEYNLALLREVLSTVE